MLAHENNTTNLTAAKPGSKINTLLKIGVITVGTQIGTELIHKMAKHPVALFSLGFATGVYAHLNRKKIIEAANQLKQQSRNLLS
jgi:hypothetical protein